MEVALGLQITKFTETLEDMFIDLAPNRLTEYIYELANLFTSFYTECKVRLLPGLWPGLLLHPVARRASAMAMRPKYITVHRMMRLRTAFGAGVWKCARGLQAAALRSHRSGHAPVLDPAGHQAAVPDMRAVLSMSATAGHHLPALASLTCMLTLVLQL